MTERLTPDICVIGGGPAGLSAAAAAVALGASVVLIAPDMRSGGGVRGGVPAAALLAAARQIVRIGEASAFGIAAQAKVSFGKVFDHVHAVVEIAARNASAVRLAALGVRVIAGAAHFHDAATVGVRDEDITVAARHVILATGASPLMPPIAGLGSVPCLTAETLFDLNSLPKHLLVLGADPYALALAQAFRRLGSEVTVFAQARPFATEDEECAAIVCDALEAEGITIRSGVTVASVRKAKTKIAVTVRDADGAATPEDIVEGTHLLIAAGRAPHLDALALERAGISCGAGGIVVDDKLRTTNKRVYAIGDVAFAEAGRMRTQATAEHQAGVAVRNALLRTSEKSAHAALARVIPTDPALAHVGLTETEARTTRRRIRVLRWPFHENDRAQAERQTAGHVKIVTDARGAILGATIVGPRADDLIALWALAIDRGLNIRALAGLVLPYPSFGEAGMRAAMTSFETRLTSSWPRRIIRAMRVFG